jgi:glutathione S-transferase
MGATKITLHDLPSKLPGGRAISPFTTIVRYALNYRGLEFKTEWRSYTDLETVAKAVGAKPTGERNGAPKYTVPFIVDETSGTPVAISDSMAIIQYIETTYPDPARPLLLPNPNAPAQHLLAISAVSTIVFSLFRTVLFPGVYNLILDEEKEVWLGNVTGGQPPESFTLAPGSPEYKETVEKTKESLKNIAGFLEKQSGNGIWFGGDRPVYIDFATVSFLNMLRFATPELWTEVAAIDGRRLDKLVQACEQYAKV